jgi:hypothetical protein
MASSLSTTKDEIIAKFGLDAQISPIDEILAEAAESESDANLSKEPDYSDHVTARREF